MTNRKIILNLRKGIYSTHSNFNQMRNLRFALFVLLLGMASNLVCQNSYTAHVDQPDPLNIPSICVVTTVDTNNVVVWEKNNSIFTAYFGVYRESTRQTDQWDLLGVVNYGETSLFVDSTSNPANQSYNYKISGVDLCGNETGLSSSHKTMNLSVALGINSSFSLIWSEYKGFVVNSYDIYRGTNESDLQKIASTAAGNFSYNDYNPPMGDVYYQIEVVSPNNCDPTQLKSINSYNSSRSNMVNTMTTHVLTHKGLNSDLIVYPNPFINSITVEIPNFTNYSYYFTIYDFTGHEVYKRISNSAKIEFVRGDLLAGIYFIEVNGKELFYKKIIITD
jgi:hypothetical protein